LRCHNAARIVAVVAQPRAEKEFGFVKRTECRGELWAGDHRNRIARVRRLQHGIHGRGKIIATQTEGGPPPVGPARRVLSIDADIALVHMVKKRVRKKLAAECVRQADIDIVVTGLQTQHRLAWPIE
jgi:hypothetical protein